VRGGRAGALAGPVVLAVAVLVLLPAVAAQAGSLPTVASGPQPGPGILYAPPPRAPQLENTGVWTARPILISGASAYRDGEFLYQDWLYDDHGARAARDPQDPRRRTDEGASAPSGSYTYPTDPAYAGNAADLVELRVRALRRATAFRVTLNTLVDPDRVAFTIAIGGTPEVTRELPYGANTSSPADLFLTVHGGQGSLTDAVSGTQLAAPRVKVDLRRRQFTVQVAHADWDPGAGSVRLSAGVGLWDRQQDRYLIPAASATPAAPGGAGGLARPSAIFNAAFRFQEPFQGPDFTVLTDATWWRDRIQGRALAQNDLGRFRAEVDFSKLIARVDDDLAGQPGGVPQDGPMNRILASRFETAQGIDFSTVCLGGTLPQSCKGEYRGRLQPYSIYVPHKPAPVGGYGLTLLLHSLDGTYNQYSISRNQSQYGERGEGSIVITPQARGPDGFYFDHAAADVFEVWADVARRYPLDPDWTAIAGYSMGGYGAYKLAAQFPDLFARAQTTVGPPGLGSADTRPLLPSLRNVPVMIWAGSADELVPIADVRSVAQLLDDLGYRYTFFEFPATIHILLAFNDQYAPAADFLGSARVDRDPAHVTYAYNPALDFADAGTAAGHAYWLSDLTPRDPSANGGVAVADVRSEGFGAGDPAASPTAVGSGLLTGGIFPLPFVSRSKAWGAAPAAPVADRLVVGATNVASLTIDPRRARVTCDAQVVVASAEPVDVRLAGCEPPCRKSVPAHGRNGRPPGLCRERPGGAANRR
jgi:predicted esterase